eukprot:scaffold77562_cov63-Phaeocystis_antarctica.AAC.1
MKLCIAWDDVRVGRCAPGRRSNGRVAGRVALPSSPPCPPVHVRAHACAYDQRDSLAHLPPVERRLASTTGILSRLYEHASPRPQGGCGVWQGSGKGLARVWQGSGKGLARVWRGTAGVCLQQWLLQHRHGGGVGLGEDADL